jgi:hypothetical protein
VRRCDPRDVNARTLQQRREPRVGAQDVIRGIFERYVQAPIRADRAGRAFQKRQGIGAVAKSRARRIRGPVLVKVDTLML